jgi:peptide/nickel transport system permease protein
MTEGLQSGKLVVDARPALQPSGYTRRAFTHARHYVSLWAGALILAVFTFLVLFGPLLAPYDPLKQDLKNRLKPPMAEHVFGTDELGRDIFSRVIYGTRISLPASVFVVVVSLTMGTLLGAFA